MHLIQDENGNPIPHGDHDHCSHEHDHCEHEHDHCDHDHCENAKPMPADALLDYMLSHNQHHAAELQQMSEKLRSEGLLEAASHIEKAVEQFQKGNMFLSAALSSVKER